MATFKTLLDNECGTTNPLIKLTQFYKHDNTRVKQVIKIYFSVDCIINIYLLGWYNYTIFE